MLKFWVDRCDIKGLKTIDGSEDFDLTWSFFVVNVFDDKAYFIIDIIVGAYVGVDLGKFAKSLGEIHAALFDNTSVRFVEFSLDDCGRVWK